MESKRTTNRTEIGFDTARIFASIAIVWVHTPRSEALTPAMPIGVFGTAFFAAAAMFFMARGLNREPGREFTSYLRKRIVRLGAPFVVWTLFYVLFRDFCRVYIAHESAVSLNPGMLLVGSEMQLWFLPFLLLASVLMFPLVKFATRSASHRQWTGWIMALAGLIVAIRPFPHVYGSEDVRHFQKCVWFVLPCVFWGLSAAMNYELLSRTVLQNRWTPLIGLALTVGSMVVIAYFGNNVLCKNLGGLGWLIVSLSLPSSRLGSLLAKLAPLGFGIYLTHPFFQGVFRAISQKVHFGPTAANDLALFAFTVAGALAFSWLLRQNTRTAWLIA